MKKDRFTPMVWHTHLAHTSTGLLILVMALLMALPIPALARRHQSRRSGPHIALRTSRHRQRHLRAGHLCFTRPPHGKYCHIGGHRYWLADRVLYDIVKKPGKGTVYVVVKVIK